ncbi:MAG: 50S ribosomal protein L25/general stress protein Ctc [Bacteroidetes bacterium]|nr:50S ribosomal protein L25/general stress protein Ctc [Bacteroidota bacterium]
MKTISMSGSQRENVGKKDARMHRREGKVPCVLYGGKEQIKFAVEEKAFKKVLFTPEVFQIRLNIDNQEHDAILQDVQYHPVTDVVMHADFLELVPGRPVIVALPFKTKGTSEGVLQGGKLHKKKRKIRVKGLVEHLPDYIELDITPLKIGDSIKVGDIHIEHLEMLDSARDVVVNVKVTRVVAPVVEGEAAPAIPAAEGGAVPAAPAVK